MRNSWSNEELDLMANKFVCDNLIKKWGSFYHFLLVSTNDEYYNLFKGDEEDDKNV